MQTQAGCSLIWSLMPNGAVIVRAKTKSLLDLGGMLKAAGGKKRVRINDMNPWR
jgi:hypothetical protein